MSLVGFLKRRFGSFDFFCKFLALILNIVCLILWLTNDDYVSLPVINPFQQDILLSTLSGYMVFLSAMVLLYWCKEVPNKTSQRVFLVGGANLFILSATIGVYNGVFDRDLPPTSLVIGILFVFISLILLLNHLSLENWYRSDVKPSGGPSKEPSGGPSKGPSGGPSERPSGRPSRGPSGGPNREPSGGPSGGRSRGPSRGPSGGPSGRPSGRQSGGPSGGPKQKTESPPERRRAQDRGSSKSPGNPKQPTEKKSPQTQNPDKNKPKSGEKEPQPAAKPKQPPQTSSQPARKPPNPAQKP